MYPWLITGLTQMKTCNCILGDNNKQACGFASVKKIEKVGYVYALAPLLCARLIIRSLFIM